MDAALDAGADDINDEETTYEVITDPGNLEEVKNSLEKNSFAWSFAEISMVPQNTISLEGKEAGQLLKLMEMLEDSDDVQKVYANFDISEREMQKIS